METKGKSAAGKKGGWGCCCWGKSRQFWAFKTLELDALVMKLAESELTRRGYEGRVCMYIYVCEVVVVSQAMS